MEDGKRSGAKRIREAERKTNRNECGTEKRNETKNKANKNKNETKQQSQEMRSDVSATASWSHEQTEIAEREIASRPRSTIAQSPPLSTPQIAGC